jgi:Zn-finger nucleic acid-binding protein
MTQREGQGADSDRTMGAAGGDARMEDAVGIDDCPECRGVWLDRGELDKIIERTAASRSVCLVQGAERRTDA